MKLSYVLSGTFILALVIVVILQITPKVDQPTRATAAERLRLVGLGDDFPRLYQVTEPNADAMTHYRAAVDYYEKHHKEWGGNPPSDTHYRAMAEHMIAGMKAGRIKDGFLDQSSTIAVGMGGNTNRLSAVCVALIDRIKMLQDPGPLTEFDAETALAVFALGERAFRHNTLLSNRQLGLELMSDGSGYLSWYQLEKDGQSSEELNLAADRFSKVIDAWSHKMKITMVPKPHVGDVLNIAKNDQDITWRLQATQKLGIAKFTDGGTGNRKAIAKYLAEARKSDNSLMAESARVADELTKEQFHQIR